jgi:hypothetical protein
MSTCTEPTMTGRGKACQEQECSCCLLAEP